VHNLLNKGTLGPLTVRVRFLERDNLAGTLALLMSVMLVAVLLVLLVLVVFVTY